MLCGASMTTNKVIAILGGIVVLALVVGAFFFGRATKRVDEVGTRIERDTIVVRDTIREYYPREVVKTIVRTERVEVPIVRCDTIRDTMWVELPIENKEYKSEEYYAIVEGYNPTLKYIEVYPRTSYITTTETIKQKKRWGVSLGVQGGYGFTPKGWQPYAGVGVSFGYSF